MSRAWAETSGLCRRCGVEVYTDDPHLCRGRFDGLAKPCDLEPPIALGRELNAVIFSDDVLHVYEQTHAIAQGWAEHPRGDGKADPLVPKFGMDAEAVAAMKKEQKKRDKQAAAEAADLRTWRDA